MTTNQTFEDILFAMLDRATDLFNQIWRLGTIPDEINTKECNTKWWDALHRLLYWMEAIETVIDEEPSRW